MTERWLVIDDSATIQRVIKLAFEDYDVQIFAADSFPSGTKELLRSAPKLVIVDASVSGTNQIQDFTALRKLAPQTPLIILQGSYDSINSQCFIDEGFEYFLRKPFDGAQLLQVTRMALGRALPQRVRDVGVSGRPLVAGGRGDRPTQTIRQDFHSGASLGLDFGLSRDLARNFKQSGSLSETGSQGLLQDFDSTSDIGVPLSRERPLVSQRFSDDEATTLMTSTDEFSHQRSDFASRSSSAFGGGQGVLQPIIQEEMEKLVRQAVEDYCRKHFAPLARELIGRELERLTQERNRLLVDK